MSKKDWALVLSLVPLVWMLDQGTKMWAVDNIYRLKFHGIFGLVLHRNPGAMLGMFSDLPAILRIVSLSTGGALLIFVYAAIQYLLPLRSLNLRLGMSLLLGGILGNVTDRILDGKVVDFLLIGTREFSTPAFNVADAIQWVGYGMIVVSLIKEGNQFWPEKNERKRIWVQPKFQIKYVFVLLAIGLGFSIISGVFSYTYIKVIIDDFVVGNPINTERRFLVPFLITFSVISFGFLVILFLIGRVLSHRMAGPLYAFELYVEDLLDGKDRTFKTRKGDEFQHLEEIAETLRERITPPPSVDSSVNETPAEKKDVPAS